MRRGFTPILLLVIVLILAGIGFVTYQSFGIKMTEQVVASPSPSSNPTADWKTISRKNWSFKVPTDWNYLECSDNAIYVDPSNKSDQTLICEFEPYGFLWVNREDRSYQIPETRLDTQTNQKIIVVSDRKNITVAGLSASQQTEEVFREDISVKSVRVYVKTDKSTYIITFTDLNQLGIFSQILSTFEFVGGSNLKTYKGSGFVYDNDVYSGYTFQYPSFCEIEKGGRDILHCKTKNGTANIRIDAGGHGGPGEVKVISDNIITKYPFGEVTVTLIEVIETKKLVGTYWVNKTAKLEQSPIFGFEIYPSPIATLTETEQIMNQILSSLEFTLK